MHTRRGFPLVYAYADVMHPGQRQDGGLMKRKRSDDDEEGGGVRIEESRDGISAQRQEDPQWNCGLRHDDDGKRRRDKLHPNNIYAYRKPDFQKLGETYEWLQPYIQDAKNEEKKQRIDFTNPDACRALAKAQFEHDFGVCWDLCGDYLVPPLANRLNYLCWIDDLIHLFVPEDIDWKWNEMEDGETMLPKIVRIMDVGCGANLVYPLLGASYFGWNFVGADINAHALQSAVRNREANPHVAPMILLRYINTQFEQGKQLFPVTQGVGKGIISSVLMASDGVFHATMCNPPFFGSMEEAGRNPSTDYKGTPLEMVYPGGEEAFVRHMIEDSITIKNKVVWFTTMVGKKDTLKMARKLIYSIGATVELRTTEFIQGKTSRWGVAWTFMAPKNLTMKPLIHHTYSNQTSV